MAPTSGRSSEWCSATTASWQCLVGIESVPQAVVPRHPCSTHALGKVATAQARFSQASFIAVHTVNIAQQGVLAQKCWQELAAALHE